MRLSVKLPCFIFSDTGPFSLSFFSFKVRASDNISIACEKLAKALIKSFSDITLYIKKMRIRVIN